MQYIRTKGHFLHCEHKGTSLLQILLTSALCILLWGFEKSIRRLMGSHFHLSIKDRKPSHLFTQSPTVKKERGKEANWFHFKFCFDKLQKKMAYISTQKRMLLFLKAIAFLLVSLSRPDPPCPPPYPKTIRLGASAPTDLEEHMFYF